MGEKKLLPEVTQAQGWSPHGQGCLGLLVSWISWSPTLLICPFLSVSGSFFAHGTTTMFGSAEEQSAPLPLWYPGLMVLFVSS